jgi:hypothetical protein
MIAGAVACGSMDATEAGSRAFDGDNGFGRGGSGSTGIPGTGGSSSQQEPPPEQEIAQSFQVPVVSGRWVWAANPSSGRVALIDADSLAVRTALAGAGPTYLTALPADGKLTARALVINSASEDATLLSAGDEGAIEAAASVPIHSGANAWVVTADGRFAVAWTNAAAIAAADPSDGFQDITVLDLAENPPVSKRLSVGYRPTRLFVDDDDRYVYVVTDSGIDVVDLLSDEGPIVEREVELSLNPASDTAKRDVSVTPDGKRAFVSRAGKDYVSVVDLDRGTFVDVAMPGVVTDLDLSADASLAVAIIRQPAASVMGEGGARGEGEGGAGGTGEGGGDTLGVAGAGGDGAGQSSGDAGGEGGSGGAPAPSPQPQRSIAVLLPVATIFEAPDAYDSVTIDELFGSVELGVQGGTALLYSNATPTTHLTLLGVAEGDGFKQHRTLDLRLPVASAFSTPDGAHAIALLKPPPGSAQPGAFAVVPVARNLPAKIQGTLAATVPDNLASGTSAMVALDDTRALVTVNDNANTHLTYLVRMPELVVDPIPLASAPLPGASGIVREANRAFVAQRHPQGRITFIDLDSGEQRTLTGFELSDGVMK